MSGKDIFEAMSYVDERFIDEAENRMLPHSAASPWRKAAPVAACLCLLLAGLYGLLPHGSEELTEGSPHGVIAEGGAVIQESQTSLEGVMDIPGDPADEVPSVILRVEKFTDTGFTATVAELVDTDIFEIGMELNVVVAEGTGVVTPDANSEMSGETKGEFYLLVQFIQYDRETGTIVVNAMEEIIKKG